MDKSKDKILSFILIFFLGIFGVHKFIKKDNTMGIIYLCTLGLFGIGWLIDLIIAGRDIVKNISKNPENESINNSNIVINNSINRGKIEVQSIYLNIETIEKLRKKYIAFDIETTGLNANVDRIIELGAVKFENGEIIDEFNSLVNAGVSNSFSAMAVNHITNEMITSAPKEDIVYDNLKNFLGEALNGEIIICAHNASFDISFLKETLERLNYTGTIKYIDTLSLSRKFIKDLPNYKQDTVAKHFNFINKEAHRAVTDATVCGQILWKLIEIGNIEFEKPRKKKEYSKPTK